METRETKYQSGKLNEKYEISKDEKGFYIKDGKYEKWFENGKKECEGEYIENRKFGYWKYWHKNGETKEEGEYFNDEKGDDWKTYTFVNPEVKEEINKPDLTPTLTSHAGANISQNHTPKIDVEITKDNFDVLPIPISHETIREEGIKETPKQNYEVRKPVATKNTNTLYIVFGGAGLIIIILLIYIIADKNDSKKEIVETKVTTTQGVTKSQEDTRKRELESKERELALKEKELEKQKIQQPDLSKPDGVVTKFIQSLGKQDWSAAFGLMTDKRRGSYSNFSSTKAYGGITSTTIYSCSYTGETNGKKEVLVDYESLDPANKSGRLKQYYYLTPYNDSYLITDIKNINLEWY